MVPADRPTLRSATRPHRVLAVRALSSLLVVAPVAVPGFADDGPRTPSVPPSQRRTLGHSHNDYERPRPLQDALAAGMDSVEADVWLRGGRVVVSHFGLLASGTLEALYLEPLRDILARRTSVLGDGRPFLLWLELKQSDPALVHALAQVLDRFPFLSTFTDDGVRPGPVTAVLTGDRANKVRFVQSLPVRRAVRDDEAIAEADAPADGRWQWYSLDWFDYFQWTGRGSFPDDQRRRLESLVRLAHERGRRLRLFGTPENEGIWDAAVAARVDVVGTDDPGRLRRFLAAP